MFSLANKIALVTGAGSGIGAAIAQSLARAGAEIFVADRDRAAGEKMRNEIKTSGASAAFLEIDVSDPASCDKVAAQLLGARKRLDILVNNAGIGAVGTTLQATAADLDRLYQVNVRGVFNMTKAFLPSMIEHGGGSIVNIASIGGIVGIRDRVAYCASKFAVVGLTKCMALDHAKQGVRVNCICPGRVETPFVSARLKEYPDPQKAYEEMAATQALGRMGRPEEIAAAALYLASDEAAFVTGSALLIDGGWSAGK
jgi:2-keto-3-deoxy-L-fuconate dehydrogenase